MGHKMIETPVLDKFAKESLTLHARLCDLAALSTILGFDLFRTGTLQLMESLEMT